MMKDSYLKRYLHRMAVHCHSATVNMGQMEKVVMAYRVACKQRRPVLDREFKQLYNGLARIIGEEKALDIVDHMFNSNRAKARAY